MSNHHPRPPVGSGVFAFFPLFCLCGSGWEAWWVGQHTPPPTCAYTFTCPPSPVGGGHCWVLGFVTMAVSGYLQTPPPPPSMSEQGFFEQLGITGGGGSTPATPPPPPEKSFSSGPSANQTFSLAPWAPISLDQKFSSAPLKTQHHAGEGGAKKSPVSGTLPRTPGEAARALCHMALRRRWGSR